MLPLPGATTQLYLLPITGLPPDADRDALEIPATEIHRAGLTDAKQFTARFLTAYRRCGADSGVDRTDR